MWVIDIDRGKPIEVAASRNEFGTSVSISSVVRTTTGMTITASATPPAQPGEMPHGRDHDFVDEQPDHDRGRTQKNVVDETDHVLRRSYRPYSAI